jgi:hypothetical protein
MNENYFMEQKKKEFKVSPTTDLMIDILVPPEDGVSYSVYIYKCIIIYVSGDGAYFTDDPRKSQGYTCPDPTYQTHVIFYSKVVLGIPSVQNTDNKTLISAPVDCHSVQGTGGTHEEYIVYRYGQALPYLKIIYKC